MANLDSRIWVDGCWDFFHHGHAGALMQARQHGEELYVGVHSDAEIERNKGPVVMTEAERELAVEANKWSTRIVPDAPYVTDPAVMDEYQCQYVVHGDDITTDANGNDSYQQVKDLGRFVVVKRTPNISTTDLIQRMLSASAAHHLPPVTAANAEHPLLEADAVARFRAYATDASAKRPHAGVWAVQDQTDLRELVAPAPAVRADLASSAFYVPGSFDLLHSGHFEFLREVKREADAAGGVVVVGLLDDATARQARGANFPIMNIYERALSLLQTRYVDALVLGAPFAISPVFLAGLDAAGIRVAAVYRGPAPIITDAGHGHDAVDPFTWAREKGLLRTVAAGKYGDVSAESIVARVLGERSVYEERQRKKGVKAANEKKLRAAEVAEQKYTEGSAAAAATAPRAPEATAAAPSAAVPTKPAGQ